MGGLGKLRPESAMLLQQAVSTGAKQRKRDIDSLWPKDQLQPS
jgi:hypothetical protein